MKTTDTIEHLLGYLNSKQWADAIRQADQYKDFSFKEIYELLQAQEDRYGGGIISDVVDDLCDRNGQQTPLGKKVAKHFGIECGDA